MSNRACAVTMLRASLITSVLLACLGWMVPARSAEGPADNPIMIYTQDAGSRAPGGLADQLLEHARSQGEVRVIIGLRMTMRKEHTLDADQIAAQRRSLAALQGSVATRVLGAAGAARADLFKTIPYMSMFVNELQLQRLLSDPDVVSIQEDVPVEPALNDSTKIIHANNIWAKGFNGTGQAVAILDTGVATGHPMFAGKLLSEACYSSNNPPTYSTVCPGGVTESTDPGSAINCNVAWKGCDHGTHVAGIAVGNSGALDGVARDAGLIAMQVFSHKFSGGKHSVVSFSTDQIKALERVLALRAAHKIAAVNMSLGGGKFDVSCDATDAALTTAITNLRDVGIATIIASGNNGYTGFISSPACISTAIAVGNTTKTDLIAKSSNHSALVKLMAPGTDIKSAVPGDDYKKKSGTSMAAPHVAGALALLRNVKPSATVDEMLQALTCSGKIVDQRFDGANPTIETDPQRPRIDLLGAFNHLKKPSNVIRTWPFDAAAELNDWSPLRGQWALSGGNYVATAIPGGVGSHVANCNTALKINARLQRVDAQADPLGLHWNSGIMFKTTTNFTDETVSGYWVAYNKCRTNASSGNCTGLPEDKPGQAVFWIISGFNHETGGVVSASLRCQQFIPIVVGGFNTIKVVSNGSSHTHYLNGKLVCTVTDGTYASGGITLDAFFPNPATGHSLAFDSVTTQSIGSNAPLAADAGVVTMDPASMAPVATPSNMNIMYSSSQ